MRIIDSYQPPVVLHKCDLAFMISLPFVYRYVPPFLWGKSGHIQTIVFGAIGRFLTPQQEGERHSIILSDGSTVYYDIFEPETVKYDDVIIFVCPGEC